MLSKSRTTLRTGKSLSKSDLLDEVIRFIIKENIPVVKVESPHLKRLLEGMCMIIICYYDLKLPQNQHS